MERQRMYIMRYGERRTRSNRACWMVYWDVLRPCEPRVELFLLEIRQFLLELVL